MVNLSYYFLIALFASGCLYNKINNIHTSYLENSTNEDILMIEDNNLNQNQIDSNVVFDVIKNNNLSKFNCLINTGMSLFYRDSKTGVWTLHMISQANNSNFMLLFCNKYLESMRRNKQNFFEPDSIEKWINIEDFRGLTPLDHINCNKFDLKKDILKILNRLKAKQGTGIRFENKLKNKKYYFKLFEDLRFCFYSNDNTTAVHLINYLEKNKIEVFNSIFKFWFSLENFEDLFIPTAIINTINTYYGSWHDLKINNKGNYVLDEVVYMRGKESKIYEMMFDIGCKNSDVYIESKLLNDFLRIQNYKMYLNELRSFFSHNNSIRFIGKGLGPFNSFIKKAMDLGDFETISLFLSHSKVFIDQDIKDLINYAREIIKDENFVNLLTI